MTEKFSDEKLAGFKEWLEVTGIDPDIFSEEQYKTALLMSAFIEFQAQVTEAIMNKQGEGNPQPTSQGPNIMGAETKSENKNGDNVIEFPGNKK